MNNVGNMFDEFEAELIRKHKAITPEQFAEEERRRKVKRDYEALHTPIETDNDQNDDEYPDDDDEVAI